MVSDPHDITSIPIGIPVIGGDGQPLGRVHEVHAHYLLVGEAGRHEDFDVPVHAIVGVEGGALRVSVTRDSVTPVDNVETAHRQEADDHPEH